LEVGWKLVGSLTVFILSSPAAAVVLTLAENNGGLALRMPAHRPNWFLFVGTLLEICWNFARVSGVLAG
jgi:hypothetical protein